MNKGIISVINIVYLCAKIPFHCFCICVFLLCIKQIIVEIYERKIFDTRRNPVSLFLSKRIFIMYYNIARGYIYRKYSRNYLFMRRNPVSSFL